jgi:hypothetical protein
MTAKIQVRRDTTANWNAGTPPTLDVGEIGLDTDLKQIKIGDNTLNWTALPWLGGTLPNITPTADIDDVANRATGLYRWSGIASITSGTVPAAPIDIKAADGGINMLVLKFGTTVMQHLWTDSDGTASTAPKSYTRVYDGDVPAWRAWVPQNSWGISATEGVDIAAKSIELKSIATFSAGTAAAPAITTAGDLDTGIAFTAANTVVVATSGTAAITVGPSQGVTMASNAVVTGNLTVSGNMAADLNMNSQRLTNLADPTSAQHAVTKAYLETSRIGQSCTVWSDGSAIRTMIGPAYSSSGSVTPPGFSLSAGTTPANNNYDRIRAPAGTTWRGLALQSGATSKLFMIEVTNTTSTIIDGTAGSGGVEMSYIMHRTA